MALTPAQATLAASSLLDVFTPDGNAGVVARLHTFTTPGAVALHGKEQCAHVTGAHIDEWYPISDLEPSRDLLALEKCDAAGLR